MGFLFFFKLNSALSEGNVKGLNQINSSNNFISKILDSSICIWLLGVLGWGCYERPSWYVGFTTVEIVENSFSCCWTLEIASSGLQTSLDAAHPPRDNVLAADISIHFIYLTLELSLKSCKCFTYWNSGKNALSSRDKRRCVGIVTTWALKQQTFKFLLWLQQILQFPFVRLLTGG